MNNIFVSAIKDVAFLPETRWMGIIGIACNYKTQHILPIMQRSTWELCGETIKESWGALNAKRTYRYRPSIERFDSYEDAVHVMNRLLQAIYNPIVTPQGDAEVEWFQPETNYPPEFHKTRKVLKTWLGKYQLTTRTYNTLKSAEIRTVGDLVRCEIGDFMKFRNFGKKCLTEIETLVMDINEKNETRIHFGMHTEQYRLKED